VVTVTTEEAYVSGRRLGTEEGVLAGISAGAPSMRPWNWQRKKKMQARPLWPCCRTPVSGI